MLPDEQSLFKTVGCGVWVNETPPRNGVSLFDGLHLPITYTIRSLSRPSFYLPLLVQRRQVGEAFHPGAQPHGLRRSHREFSSTSTSLSFYALKVDFSHKWHQKCSASKKSFIAWLGPVHTWTLGEQRDKCNHNFECLFIFGNCCKIVSTVILISPIWAGRNYECRFLKPSQLASWSWSIHPSVPSFSCVLNSFIDSQP